MTKVNRTIRQIGRLKERQTDRRTDRRTDRWTDSGTSAGVELRFAAKKKQRVKLT